VTLNSGLNGDMILIRRLAVGSAGIRAEDALELLHLALGGRGGSKAHKS